jgi:hypothetical protein
MPILLSGPLAESVGTRSTVSECDWLSVYPHGTSPSGSERLRAVATAVCVLEAIVTPPDSYLNQRPFRLRERSQFYRLLLTTVPLQAIEQTDCQLFIEPPLNDCIDLFQE